MEAVSPRTIWVTEMGYEVDLPILETYAKALLNAPREPSKGIFGNAETIKSNVSMQKRTKKEKSLSKMPPRRPKKSKKMS